MTVFDIGFSEILMIGLVALLVLGPERLPKAARLAGLWVRKARTQWNAVKAELENEIADEELRRNLRESHAQLRDGLGEMQALADPSRLPPAGSLPQQSAADALSAVSLPAAIEGTVEPDPLRDMMEIPARPAQTPLPETVIEGDNSNAAHAPPERQMTRSLESEKSVDD